VAYAPQIAQAAAKYGVDPVLLASVAAQETGGPDTNAGANIVGDGGHGHGVFQIDDRWHSFAKSSAAMDPGSNANYAAGMISGLLNRYGGNVHEALSAYNAGSPTAAGTTTRWSDGSTLGYADSVMRHYQRISGNATPNASAVTAITPVVTPDTISTAGNTTLSASNESALQSADQDEILGEAIAERSSTLGNVNALSQYQQSSNQNSSADPFADIISAADSS
jgi:hypothetical protein